MTTKQYQNNNKTIEKQKQFFFFCKFKSDLKKENLTRGLANFLNEHYFFV